MVRRLRLRESNADAISQVIRSRVVRDKLDEFRDNFYGDGTYAEKFGNEVTYHDITDVRCTIEDVWTEVLGNPGIWDIICHADVKWDWDEDTDTVGTREYFSFYYNPTTDTIVEDADIHTMEQDMIPLVGESSNKNYHESRSIREDSDGEYTVNGHWLASATYADGTKVEKEFPYTAENYREEQEEQYRLESWLLDYHPDCTWYSVSFVEDW